MMMTAMTVITSRSSKTFHPMLRRHFPTAIVNNHSVKWLQLSQRPPLIQAQCGAVHLLVSMKGDGEKQRQSSSTAATTASTAADVLASWQRQLPELFVHNQQQQSIDSEDANTDYSRWMFKRYAFLDIAPPLTDRDRQVLADPITTTTPSLLIPTSMSINDLMLLAYNFQARFVHLINTSISAHYSITRCRAFCEPRDFDDLQEGLRMYRHHAGMPVTLLGADECWLPNEAKYGADAVWARDPVDAQRVRGLLEDLRTTPDVHVVWHNIPGQWPWLDSTSMAFDEH